MTTLEMRNKAHQLVDEASEGYLVEVLDLLQIEHTPDYKHHYSKEDIERFNQQSELYKQGKLETYTFEEVKAMIQNKHQSKNAV
jgi:hypothetical protein